MDVSTPSRKTATAVTKAATAVIEPKTSTPDTARAPIENEPQAPLVTIADIRRWMAEADQKLEMAHDAAETGEYIETLLGHICHSVLVPPLHTIQREDLTQGDVRHLYDSLFVPLACIEGAIKLAHGSILQHMLEGAFELLDAAHSALDPVNDAVKALPIEAASSASQSPGRREAVSFEGSGIEDNAYKMGAEVIAIIRACLQDVGSDLVYGALYVVERAQNALARGVHARDFEMCDEASAPFACAIAVLAMSIREYDDDALRGALRLLQLAKTSLDDALEGAK
ncbi:hypothetical protein ABID97_001911 [Variovorax sp. OAS795]|uniref:hypothetical protein n=1 Tax=Variovorax sp. OAS795 TaxID=3034231 RepID=UPI00339505C6